MKNLGRKLLLSLILLGLAGILVISFSFLPWLGVVFLVLMLIGWASTKLPTKVKKTLKVVWIGTWWALLLIGGAVTCYEKYWPHTSDVNTRIDQRWFVGESRPTCTMKLDGRGDPWTLECGGTEDETPYHTMSVKWSGKPGGTFTCRRDVDHLECHK